MAFPAMVTASVLTGALVWACIPEWSFWVCWLIGIILSATDPVAVVALLKELGAAKTLGSLIEGESLLNDGSAVVLFTWVRNAIGYTSAQRPPSWMLGANGDFVRFGGQVGIDLVVVVSQVRRRGHPHPTPCSSHGAPTQQPRSPRRGGARRRARAHWHPARVTRWQMLLFGVLFGYAMAKATLSFVRYSYNALFIEGPMVRRPVGTPTGRCTWPGAHDSAQRPIKRRAVRGRRAVGHSSQLRSPLHDRPPAPRLRR